MTALTQALPEKPGPFLPWGRGLRYQGVTYDLQHLRSFQHTFEQSATEDKPAATYTVEVSFSHHCFTRGLPADAYDRIMEFTHANEVRLFDARRWVLSKSLPELIAALPNKACRHTGKGNFLTVSSTAEDGTPLEYEVYFQVRKAGKRLRLFVESAYVREESYKSSRPNGNRIGFLVILHNVLHGKKIRS